MPSAIFLADSTWHLASTFKLTHCPFPIHGLNAAGEVQLQLDEAVRAVTQAGIHVVVAAGEPGCH